MKIVYGACTDTGFRRTVNQDSYGVSAPPPAADPSQGRLFVVCDGMGGHTAGEVASKLAVETILQVYSSSRDSDRTRSLAESFQAANVRVFREGQSAMGTTGVAALLVNATLYVANVGDSRAYLVRNRQMFQLTRDHSLVWEQVSAGILSPEQARESEYRNMITRALGYQDDLTVDLFAVPLQPGDTILLCTDGLHGVITEQEILEMLIAHEPDEAVRLLVDAANAKGGPDNITVIAARVETLEWDPPEPIVPAELAAEVAAADAAAINAEDIENSQPVAVATAPAPKSGGQWSMLTSVLVLLVIGISIIYASQHSFFGLIPMRTPTPRMTTPSTVMATLLPTLTETSEVGVILTPTVALSMTTLPTPTFVLTAPSVTATLTISSTPRITGTRTITGTPTLTPTFGLRLLTPTRTGTPSPPTPTPLPTIEISQRDRRTSMLQYHYVRVGAQ